MVYRAEGDAVVAAGYLVAQSDLAAGRRVHVLTLRDLDFPAARRLTGGELGLYTIHMYLLPEEIYLPWEAEPDAL